MSRMIEAWEKLIHEATDRNEEVQDNAVFLIAMILERHTNPKAMPPELYERYLSRELLRLVLDDKRQQETADFLMAMVRSNDATAESFLYALSKCQPKHLIAPLLSVIRERGRKWSVGAMTEAAKALLGCLKKEDAVVIEALHANNPVLLLDEWAEHDDDDLADKADLAYVTVKALLGTDA